MKNRVKHSYKTSHMGPVTMTTNGISFDIFRPQHHHKQHHHSLYYHYLRLLQNGTPLKMHQPAQSSAACTSYHIPS